MLEYHTFKDIFDEKIFAKSKADLLGKVAEYPDRYVGLFRPTKPEAKLLQNLLQSNEIRFGDAFEKVIEKYLVKEGWIALPKVLHTSTGETLNIDQLLEKNGEILFIEQKVRDDHDSAKKRGQIDNFEKKLEALVRKYGTQITTAYFYFIDPTLMKNKNYYVAELDKLQEAWGIELFVLYGEDLFTRLHHPEIWADILKNLRQWRQDIPDLPEVNLDLQPQESAIEIKGLSLRIFRKLFDDQRVVEQILPVLFPTGSTLIILEPYFRAQGVAVTINIADKMHEYIQSRSLPKVTEKTYAAPITRSWQQPIYLHENNKSGE